MRFLNDQYFSGNKIKELGAPTEGTDAANKAYVDGLRGLIPSGTCDSTSTSKAKTVTIAGITALTDGLLIMVANNSVASASGVTLNVNGLGAKRIQRDVKGTATYVTTQITANSVHIYSYNSTEDCWRLIDYDANTTYSGYSFGLGAGVCDTAEATLAKTATISSYELGSGGVVSIRFLNAVPANSTLNIRSRGANAIYYRNAAITDGVIKAGDTATFMYDGTNYVLLTIDRWIDDLTHVADTTVSTSTKTITFAANQRGSQMISISADLALTFAVNNASDNYLWIKNTGSSEVDITISAVTNSGGNSVANVYLPEDGISIPAGHVCELGIIVNADGAFITSRNDLTL